MIEKEDGIVTVKTIGGKFHVIIGMGNVTFLKIIPFLKCYGLVFNVKHLKTFGDNILFISIEQDQNGLKAKSCVLPFNMTPPLKSIGVFVPRN
jgi:hypothetical protein